MDLNVLKVPILKAQLLARSISTKGSKAVLIGRLSKALHDEDVDVANFISQLLGSSLDPARGDACGARPLVGQLNVVPSDSAASPTEAVESHPSGSGQRSFAAGPMNGGSIAVPAEVDRVLDAGICEDVVRAEDGASRFGGASSGHSSQSSASLTSLRIQESANQAALKVRLRFLKETHELQLKLEELELRAALEESEAREAALASGMSGSEVAAAGGASLNGEQMMSHRMSHDDCRSPQPVSGTRQPQELQRDAGCSRGRCCSPSSLPVADEGVRVSESGRSLSLLSRAECKAK